MIVKSNIDVANLGLFILSHVLVPPKQLVALMPFCGPGVFVMWQVVVIFTEGCCICEKSNEFLPMFKNKLLCRMLDGVFFKFRQIYHWILGSNLHVSREKSCPSTHQCLSNCWRVAMISPFLWIRKVNIKLITTALCMALVHILYLFLMLGSNYPFVVIVLWLWSLILMLQILCCLSFHTYFFLSNNR